MKSDDTFFSEHALGLLLFPLCTFQASAWTVRTVVTFARMEKNVLPPALNTR